MITQVHGEWLLGGRNTGGVSWLTLSTAGLGVTISWLDDRMTHGSRLDGGRQGGVMATARKAGGRQGGNMATACTGSYVFWRAVQDGQQA